VNDDPPQIERVDFLRLAFLFEGGLLAASILLGWLVGIPVWLNCRPTLTAIVYGLVLIIPMLAFLTFANLTRLQKFVEIRNLLREVLGKPLAACRFLDLCALALLAGVSEEFLFRGVLEPWLNHWGAGTALIVTNILFGLCHSVTPTYFVLAALMGAYLSSTLWWTAEPNLLIPIFCHSLYDLVAFVVVRQSFLRELERTSHQPMAVEK
jgi:membrane protease YdiL (CAAX protease family)